MVRSEGPRDPIAGPATPEEPYPIKLRGPVIKGFGRGSHDLGIPTANIPLSGLKIGSHDDLASGIYYGWCTLDLSTVTSTPQAPATDNNSASTSTESTPAQPTRSSSHAVQDMNYASGPTTDEHGTSVLPCVLSIGYNPYYANTQRSIEIHIMHSFNEDFYGAKLALLIMGFIRPEYDYTSAEALVEDIKEDIRVARKSLARRAYEDKRDDDWLVKEIPEVKKNRAEQEAAGGPRGYA